MFVHHAKRKKNKINKRKLWLCRIWSSCLLYNVISLLCKYSDSFVFKISIRISSSLTAFFTSQDSKLSMLFQSLNFLLFFFRFYIPECLKFWHRRISVLYDPVCTSCWADGFTLASRLLWFIIDSKMSRSCGGKPTSSSLHLHAEMLRLVSIKQDFVLEVLWGIRVDISELQQMLHVLFRQKRSSPGRPINKPYLFSLSAPESNLPSKTNGCTKGGT